MLDLFNTIFQMGLLFVPVVMGVYITSRLIKLDDLTLEGSFNFGGALGAFLLVNQWHSVSCCLLVLFAGGICGMLSGFLHTRLKINHLISGLAMSALLYSVSLKLVNAHCVIGSNCSIFTQNVFWLKESFQKPLWLAFIAFSLLMLLKGFLQTETGLLLKAVGWNKDWFYKMGKDPAHYQMLGLAIANSLCALSGCLFVHWLGFYSITNYIGTWISGLNGLMIAEMIPSSLSLGLFFGSILNQALFAAVVELQMDPVWNQAIKAMLVIALLQLAKSPLRQRKKHVAAS
jgi:putative ABC transport system permease protein